MQNLKEFRPLLQDKIELVLDGFYQFIFRFEYARVFLDSDEMIERHRAKLHSWLLELFGGRYDDRYFDRLEEISETHVKIGLPAHYVDAAFSYLREAFNQILLDAQRLDLLQNVNRIVDINLDLLSLNYLDVGQKKFIDEIALLRRIIDTDGVSPYLQPIVDASTGKVEKFECLMRLVDRENEQVYSAFPFLSLAKEIHLYSIMMTKMLDQSLAFARRNPECTFTVNLGYEDIRDERCRQYLYSKIAGIPMPEKIVFEILESDFIEDFEIVKNFTEEVRRFGCRIAIDDFGSGYSNMQNILEIHPDFLKIDGSIVRNVIHSNDSLMIVKSIAQLARDLGIRTIAEHVQEREILEKIREIGLDFYQGFYFGKPFPLEELAEKHLCEGDLLSGGE